MKKEENHNEKSRLTAKKYQIKQERENKSTRKVKLSFFKTSILCIFQYKKQLERVEADLKLIEAQESISTKLKRVNYYCIFK